MRSARSPSGVPASSCRRMPPSIGVPCRAAWLHAVAGRLARRGPYFLLPDRFSDGRETTRPLLTRAEIRRLRSVDGPARTSTGSEWAASGTRWQGGTHRRHPRPARLPAGPRRQRALDRADLQAAGAPSTATTATASRTSSRSIRASARASDLVALVRDAHARGLRIILDIIANHTGDNWGYVRARAGRAAACNEPPYRHLPELLRRPRTTRRLPVGASRWRDEHQQGATFAGSSTASRRPHDAVFPARLRRPAAAYTRAGTGSLGDGEIDDPHAEHKRTDFFALKDLALDGAGHAVRADRLLQVLDRGSPICDGFRIDTVKHMALEDAATSAARSASSPTASASATSCSSARSPAASDFQDFVLDHLAVLQRNLSAALDIGGARLRLADVAKGLAPGQRLPRRLRRDQRRLRVAPRIRQPARLDPRRPRSRLRHQAAVLRGDPRRLAGQGPPGRAPATALQLFTLGIPCIYYGTEQAFAGPAQLPAPLADRRELGWRRNPPTATCARRCSGPPIRAPHTTALDAQVADATSAAGLRRVRHRRQHVFDDHKPRLRPHRRAVRRARRASGAARRPAVPAAAAPAPYRIRVPGRRGARRLVAHPRPAGSPDRRQLPRRGTRGGDIVVAAELSSPGTLYEVIANTAHTAAGAGYTGSHPLGSTLPVRRTSPTEPAFLQLRDIPPAETVVLVRRP